MEPALDGADVYWIESRPAEGGRHVIVRYTPDGQTHDVTPPGFNARTRVHEYGGGAYVVARGTVYFSHFTDQRLYAQPPGAAPQPLTTATDMLYADAVLDPHRHRLLCVREDQTAHQRDSVNTVVAIDLQGSDSVRVLVSGNDFYAAPRLSPDGTRLAWLTWNHPHMPWDSTALWVGTVRADGTIGQAERVAGGGSESLFQPEWSPDGMLHFVSDRTGWWNLYRWRQGRIEALYDMPAEFGLPQWVFGMSTYAFASADCIICTYTQQGIWYLARLDTPTRRLTTIATPYTTIASLRASPTHAVCIAGSPTMPLSVVQLDLATDTTTVLRGANTLDIDAGYVSMPHAIAFPTEQGRTAYGFFYAPQNRDVVAPAHERPPLIVISHGGPTSATSTALNLALQYWTSRGFGVLDVNYGGSTGYGRAYRERLKGQWGIVDVDDCVNGARYLVDRGDVDGKRLIIRGASAGGYTTLSALTFRQVFHAGASYYGISDLEALERDCHKFESRYNHSLIGPYPEAADLYRQRSPIHFTDRLSCPLILLQGRDDKVVPPNQAEMMFAAVRRKGLPVAYLLFDGEQHGFRRAENIKRALDTELYFYARVFGFHLADAIESVEIANL
jgi:dipeptidyl aminopeptidase/acylaminoacyl peptidase